MPHPFCDTPQSLRGGVSESAVMAPLARHDPHAAQCFQELLENERKMCKEGWAVFYHLYMLPAPLYEVHAAVGRVLFRFRAKYSSLPRILFHTFETFPDAPRLEAAFPDFGKKRDHDPEFRKVAISAMCSLFATGPEVTLPDNFTQGYGCGDVKYRQLLDKLLVDCGVPYGQASRMGDQVIAVCKKHGLDTSQFPGGSKCYSGKPGHLMQIFLREDLIDQLTYAAKPYGVPDPGRRPVSSWLESGRSTQQGQVRIVVNPLHFMRSTKVHLHVASADPTFHSHREAFRHELTQLLGSVIGTEDLRKQAAAGIFGGESAIPPWWTADDQTGIRSSCQYGAYCMEEEKDPDHHKKYSHPERCQYEECGRGCTDFTFKHRDSFHHLRPKRPCKYGKDCYDFSVKHRFEYWHGIGGWRGKEACRYAEKCTNKDAQHLWFFRHPWSAPCLQ